MAQIERMLIEAAAQTRLLLQVHDELVFELAAEEKKEVLPKIEKIMREAIPMRVPIIIESGIGDNWLDAH